MDQRREEITHIINRPRVAGAVKHLHNSLRHCTNWWFVKISSKYLHSQTIRAKELKFLEKVHQPLPVTYHVSCVTCHMSHVTLFFWQLSKVVIGGSTGSSFYWQVRREISQFMILDMQGPGFLPHPYLFLADIFQTFQMSKCLNQWTFWLQKFTRNVWQNLILGKMF